MDYFQNVSQLNNAFVQQERSEYSEKVQEAKQEIEDEKQQVLGITAPLGEGAGMDLIQRGINKALLKPGVSDAKKEILKKILVKLSSGDVKGALVDAKNEGVDFVKSKTNDLVEAVKSKVPGVKTAMEDLKGKIPDYKVLKKNLRKSIKKDLEQFKGFEEDAKDNPYSPSRFLQSLKEDNIKNDGERLNSRLRMLKTKRDLGLMNDEQAEAFDKLSSKVNKLKDLKLNPPSDLDTITADATQAPKSAMQRLGLSQARAPVITDVVEPSMNELNDRAQARLKLLNENFGTEGSAGAVGGGAGAQDESQAVPTPSRPQQDPQYLAEVKRIKAEAGEKFKLSPEDEGEVEEGFEEAGEGDFSPVSDIIGLGISLAGLFGGFEKHNVSIPKAPIPTQGAVQIGADQA
jgi:hypothetical protein